MKIPPGRSSPAPGVPGWWTRYAFERGLSPWHPETWPASEREAFMAEKRRRFRAHYRWLRESGTIDAYFRCGGRMALIHDVRRALAHVLEPFPPRNPWAVCPCHPRRVGVGLPVDVEVDEEQLQAWVAQETFIRCGLDKPTQRALAFIGTFASGKGRTA